MRGSSSKKLNLDSRYSIKCYIVNRVKKGENFYFCFQKISSDSKFLFNDVASDELNLRYLFIIYCAGNTLKRVKLTIN